MRLLLDTHAFLWWRQDSRRLTQRARRAIATADIVWVSAASGWEATIKRGLGRLEFEESFAEMVDGSDFRELPVTIAHAELADELPRHHADPFDRMLIAQASLEQATLVTHDRRCEPYGIPIIWI